MIEKNIEKIKQKIPVNVKLVVVSKFQPENKIMEAYNYGMRCFAESRPLELRNKYEVLPKDIEWHFIGHLQTNKVKYIVPFVVLIQSVDSERLLEAISQEAMKNERVVDILLQVHVAKEQTKQGFSCESIKKLYSDGVINGYKGVRVVGVMAMASFTDDMEMVKEEFLKAEKLFDEIKKEYDNSISQLSMGMSSDYLLALECGSTMVRVGSDIFGVRKTQEAYHN